MDTIPALLDPERQLLGCLMCLPLTPARRVLAGMCADDLADPTASLTLQMAIQVVGQGHAPAPAALFAHAITTGQVPEANRRSLLARWITDTYGAASLPILADHYKAIVLEAAWRRALTRYARRLLQGTEQSSTVVLAELADNHAQHDDLWCRYRDAAGEDIVRPRQHRPAHQTTVTGSEAVA